MPQEVSLDPRIKWGPLLLGISTVHSPPKLIVCFFNCLFPPLHCSSFTDVSYQMSNKLLFNKCGDSDSQQDSGRIQRHITREGDEDTGDAQLEKRRLQEWHESSPQLSKVQKGVRQLTLRGIRAESLKERQFSNSSRDDFLIRLPTMKKATVRENKFTRYGYSKAQGIWW